MKRFALSLLLSLPVLSHAYEMKINLAEHNETVKNAIAFLDGHLGRIDFNTFGIMFDVHNKIRDHRLIKFNFQDEKLSIAELAAIESNYIGSPELNQLLVVAKQGFEKLVSQFITQATGNKNLMIILIEESCHRRNRSDSLLLTWAEATEGHEMLIFHTEIQSFKGLDDFCQDLSNFLKDLMYSCPKAMEQFRKKQAEYAKNVKNAKNN